MEMTLSFTVTSVQQVQALKAAEGIILDEYDVEVIEGAILNAYLVVFNAQKLIAWAKEYAPDLVDTLVAGLKEMQSEIANTLSKFDAGTLPDLETILRNEAEANDDENNEENNEDEGNVPQLQ